MNRQAHTRVRECVTALSSSRRINVVGSSGSGKSTFSKNLARVKGLPYVEMDRLFWLPGWQMRGNDDFFQKLKEAVSEEAWVLDGNYHRTVAVKWERADCVVWLNFSFGRTLQQSVTRALGRSISGREIWPGTGNRETFRKSFFSKESIILWSVNNYRRLRERYRGIQQSKELGVPRVLELRSRRETRRVLHEIADTIALQKKEGQNE